MVMHMILLCHNYLYHSEQKDGFLIAAVATQWTMATRWRGLKKHCLMQTLADPEVEGRRDVIITVLCYGSGTDRLVEVTWEYT